MAKIITDEKLVDEILSRGVAEVIDRANLKKKLLSGKKLRIKFGIDPTSPNLHLGRAVVLLKLKELQDLGHQIVLIIGDFTGVIGDTSDKESERPMLSEALVKNNMKTYLNQAYKIIDKDKTKVFYNSEWLSKLSLNNTGELATWFSLAEFIGRENIKKRLQAGKRISLREVLYPLMQGYDSVMVDADLELGGTDQRFNMLAGREIQRYYRPSKTEREIIKKNINEIPRQRWGSSIGYCPLCGNTQDILMMNLIEGTDGRKMSSSWGNTINILDDANSMFGKIMSAGDNLIVKYFIHCTRVPMEDIEKIEKQLKAGEVNPRDIKIKLAFEITKIYHGEKKAREAQEYFEKVFSKKETPEEIIEIKIKNGESLIDILVKNKLAASKADARRKIDQGGIKIDNKTIGDWQLKLDKSFDKKVIKAGKREFRRVKIV